MNEGVVGASHSRTSLVPPEGNGEVMAKPIRITALKVVWRQQHKTARGKGCLSARQLLRFRRWLTDEGLGFSTIYDWSVNCAECNLNEEPMLRITRKANGKVVFRVSGQLNAQNVAEMETLIAAERKGRRIVLDCTDLRSVDGEAVRFLKKSEADSIKLRNCGLYIREWIRRERLERESDKSSDK